MKPAVPINFANVYLPSRHQSGPDRVTYDHWAPCEGMLEPGGTYVATAVYFFAGGPRVVWRICGGIPSRELATMVAVRAVSSDNPDRPDAPDLLEVWKVLRAHPWLLPDHAGLDS